MATTDADLAKLSVQLELQTAAFEAGVKRMDGQLRKLDKGVDKSSKRMKILNTAVKNLKRNFVALAAAVSIGALANQTKSAIAFGDSIAKTADKVGVTTSELQELRFAAGQAGVDVRALDMGLQRFARRMGEAAQGTGELLKTTQELGIEFQDEEGRYYSTTELLEQYAKAIGEAETQQEKLRLAFKAFDSEGAALVNLLADGGEEMQALREQAVELGLVLSEDLVRESEILNDKMAILSQQIKVSVTETFLEATQAVLEFFGVFADVDNAKGKLAIVEAEIARVQKLLEGNVIGRNKKALETQLANAEAEAADLREQIEALDETQKRLQRNNTATTDGIDRQANAFSRQADAIKEMLNPLLGVGRKIEEIQNLVGKGLTQEEAWAAITIEVEKYNKSLEKATGDTEDFWEFLENTPTALASSVMDLSGLESIGVTFGKEEDKILSSLEKIEKAMDGFVTDFTNDFVDGLMKGEMAFDDFAKNILATITKLLLNDIFSQFFDILYGGVKSYFGIGTAPTSQGIGQLAAYAAPTDGMTRAGEASSMMVGQVVARASPKPQSDGSVTVNVMNYGNDEVSVTDRQDSNGGLDIDILIKSKVNNGFASGAFDKTLSSSFGLRRMGY